MRYDVRMRRVAIAAFATVILAGGAKLDAQGGNGSIAPLRARLHAERTSASDLEIGGDLAGVPRGETRYLTREDLLALPQVTYTVSDDSNFNGPTQVSGVLLQELEADLVPASSAAIAVAICDDKYQANYPAKYVRAHHPILVLRVNGKPPSGWPKSTEHGNDMGPYMISHPKFVPAFKILGHRDAAQIPWGVVRMEFWDENEVFGAIAPRGPHANDADVRAGLKIAEQNCFRCHNSGAEGGKKSGVTWAVVAALATGSTEFFTEYVRNPEGKNPKTQMAASPEYDDETMRALIAYFQTFSAGTQAASR